MKEGWYDYTHTGAHHAVTLKDTKEIKYRGFFSCLKFQTSKNSRKTFLLGTYFPLFLSLSELHFSPFKPSPLLHAYGATGTQTDMAYSIYNKLHP